jgi:hypothetical protein
MLFNLLSHSQVGTQSLFSTTTTMEQPQALEQIPKEDTASSTTKKPEFRMFSKFPPDLQLMVWEFAVWGLEPRAITTKVFMPREANSRPQIERDFRDRKQHGILSLLSACRDSRQISLKTYKLCFARHFKSGKPEYFNSSKDILVVDSLELFHLFMGPFAKEGGRFIRWQCSLNWLRGPCPWDFDQIQNLALMGNLDTSVITGYIPRYLGQLRNLKTVLVPYVNYGVAINLWGYNTNTVTQIQEGWKIGQEKFMRVLGQEWELQPPVVKFMVPQEMYAKFYI